MTARNDYEQVYREFVWRLPETFNFAADVVDARAERRDGLALLWENEAGQEAQYRYSDIARESSRLADVLQREGVNKGDFVLIMLPRIPAWLIATTACLRLGAIAIPCVEMLTARDLAYRIDNSGARTVICRSEQTGKFNALLDRIDTRIAVGGAPGWLDYDEAVASAGEAAAATVAAEDPVMMYYTSGSTSSPKGVLHAARGLYAWRGSGAYWLGLTPEDRIWCTADTGWAKAGTSILFGPWSMGACSFIYDGAFSAEKRLQLLEKHKITLYCAPATELNRLVSEDIAKYDLSALTSTTTAGEAVNPVIAQRWQQATGVEVSEGYGLTEVLMIVTNYPGAPVKYGSMGRPLPGCEVAVIDDNGTRLDIDEEGQIALLVPNPQIMLHYWRDPERTAACYIDGADGRWFVTGDRAYTDEDGYFWYTGRNDDLISSAGYRIGPLEVESALMEHPGVLECAVVGKPDAARGEIVKAFVLLREGYTGATELTEQLQQHCKAITAPYKYPREIEFVDELPRTITGKIRRRDLRDRERQFVER